MRKIIVGLLLILILSGCSREEVLLVTPHNPRSVPIEIIPVRHFTPKVIETTEEVIEEEPTVETPFETITFRVTAYCSCELCCGKWAKNRPVDENGEPIVYGASGEELIAGVSCASPLDFGTVIELEGLGVLTVHDRFADWVVEKHGTYIIDVYMTDHKAAKAWGVQYVEGTIVNEI